MFDHKNYELRPLRQGQICVATFDAGQYLAFRSVSTGDNQLRWVPLDPERVATQAAITGYCAFLAQSAEAEFQPEFAVSKRQLAQLIANQAAVMTSGAPSDASLPLIKIAHLAASKVLRLALGNDIARTLSELPRLGLDIGCSRDRQALQVVINIAEQAGTEQLLGELDIKPFARTGFYSALRWLNDHATPGCLAKLAQLANHNPTAYDLALHTRATVPGLASGGYQPMLMEA